MPDPKRPDAPVSDEHYEAVNKLLIFIEDTSGKRIKFKTIVSMKTGHCSEPEDRIAQWLANYSACVEARARLAEHKIDCDIRCDRCRELESAARESGGQT